MSTHVGFRCRTCSVASEQPFNRGYDVLNALYRLRAPIREIRESATWSIEVKIADSCHTDLVDFVTEHGDHDLCILDEYGVEVELDRPTAPEGV